MDIRSLWMGSAVTIMAAGSVVESAFGHGAFPQNTPVDRLIVNLTKYIEEHPDDPNGYYRLGRVHTMALETKTGFVLAFQVHEGQPERPAEGSWAHRNSSRPATQQAVPPSPELLRTHLNEAVRLLDKAIEMRPNEAIYRLTLACALEAGESLMNEVDVWPLVPKGGNEDSEYFREQLSRSNKEASVIDELIDALRGNNWFGGSRDTIVGLAYAKRNDPEYKEVVQKLRAADWREQIEVQFFTAMCYALPVDGKAFEKPIWGGMEDWVSYEAGKEFLRVVKSREERRTDKIRLRVARETIAAFDDLPRPSAITPIVVDFANRSLDELMSTKSVRFDLDGSGRQQSWFWVKPDVGILVWDPENTGQIISGRQLFGSVSWWLFFDNGYQALDLLDDNRDGDLTGAELNGLSLWFDRNENGVSDSGEVQPVALYDITSIACQASEFSGVTPMSAVGMRSSGGQRYVTYDWIAERCCSGNVVLP